MKALALSLLIAVGGCQSIARTNEPRITHVVVCWLKDRGNQQQRDAIITETRKLKDIPGVVDISVGTTVPSTRPVVDSSYDVALVATFRNKEDLERYGTDPRHQQLLKDYIRPLVDHYKVYDIQDPGK